MASRYHWVVANLSTVGALPTGFFHLHATIPAGGVLKRFMLRHTYVGASTKTNFPEFLFPLYIDQQVAFSGGVNDGRVIYSASRRIPFTTAVDPLDLITPYKAWYSAGDNELGFNQRCSYGQSTDPGYDTEFTGFIQSQPTYPGGMAGALNLEWATLYYL